VLSALLLIVIAVFARVAFSQSDRRTIAPAVVVVVTALVLFGAHQIGAEGPLASGEPDGAGTVEESR